MNNQTLIEVTKKEIGEANIFTFYGSIDETNADSTFKIIFDSFYGNKLIFDLGGLAYGNSKFLGYLSKMNDFVAEKDGQMFLVNLKEPLKDVLEICGILLIIQNVPDVNHALKLMGITNPTTENII